MKRKNIDKLFSRGFFSTAATYAESDIYPSRNGILTPFIFSEMNLTEYQLWISAVS